MEGVAPFKIPDWDDLLTECLYTFTETDSTDPVPIVNILKQMIIWDQLEDLRKTSGYRVKIIQFVLVSIFTQTGK